MKIEINGNKNVKAMKNMGNGIECSLNSEAIAAMNGRPT